MRIAFVRFRRDTLGPDALCVVRLVAFAAQDMGIIWDFILTESHLILTAPGP